MKKIVFAILFLTGLLPMTLHAQDHSEKAVFAGGCFWCMHAEFEGHNGVTKVLSGYTGGTVSNPTYEQVSSGETGHVEAIEVLYDPRIASYSDLLSIFWSNVDPTDADGQFCDKGSQYHAGIFYFDDAQKKLAEESAAKVEKKLGQKLATFIKPADVFYEAEDYHQGYYKKNPLRYKLYKTGCGRDQKLKALND